MAVAQVVMNRVFSGFYPPDVCGVVYQNADHYLGCQFTFACDGKRKLINERGAWARANRIAKQTLEGLIYVPEVGKSTHYHALYVHPNWVREMHRLGALRRARLLSPDRLGQRRRRTGMGLGGAGAEQEEVILVIPGRRASAGPGIHTPQRRGLWIPGSRSCDRAPE
jgi:cell wall hydrolase